jgi:hypothetical protein
MNRRFSVYILVLTALVAAGGGWFGRGLFENGTPVQLKTATSEKLEAPKPPIDESPSPLIGGSGVNANPDANSATPQAITTDLLSGLEDKTLSGEFIGNGRDKLRIIVTNRVNQPVRLLIREGQFFEGPSARIVVLRGGLLDLQPNETRMAEYATLAVVSTNRVNEASFAMYVASPQVEPRLASLLNYVAERIDIPTTVAQTAALCILENLPASAFAKFSQLGGDLSKQWETLPFKVDTVDLIRALILLRELGYPDEELAITVDPQTRIEAMIDPLAHAHALQYYKIKPSDEWAYWKNELLNGELSTRHYALHGIARYFPDVALDMMPRWARESRTSQIFRVAAIQALAETQKPEALVILKSLQNEFGPRTELGKVAGDAANYLTASLTKAADIPKAPVPFRAPRMPSVL